MREVSSIQFQEDARLEDKRQKMKNRTSSAWTFGTKVPAYEEENSSFSSLETECLKLEPFIAFA
jgi:hypothetical protein